jgi:hypothetical protein
MMRSEVFTKLREWAGVLTFMCVLAFVLIWGVKATAVADRQHAQVAADVREAIAEHGSAAADRSCAATKLLAFIIFTGNERAHELKTGSYLTLKDKVQVRSFERAACRFVDTS